VININNNTAITGISLTMWRRYKNTKNTNKNKKKMIIYNNNICIYRYIFILGTLLIFGAGRCV